MVGQLLLHGPVHVLWGGETGRGRREAGGVGGERGEEGRERGEKGEGGGREVNNSVCMHYSEVTHTLKLVCEMVIGSGMSFATGVD